MRMNQPALRQKAGNPVRAASASGLSSRAGSGTTILCVNARITTYDRLLHIRGRVCVSTSQSCGKKPEIPFVQPARPDWIRVRAPGPRAFPQTQEASLMIVFCTSEDVYVHEPASLAAKSRKSRSCSRRVRTEFACGLRDHEPSRKRRKHHLRSSFAHPRTCMRMNQPALRQKAGNPVRAASASGLNPRTDSRTTSLPANAGSTTYDRLLHIRGHVCA